MEGGAVAAPPQQTPAPDAHNGHLSYIRTDADLPSAAVIDRSPIGTGRTSICEVIAVPAAVAWTRGAFGSEKTPDRLTDIIQRHLYSAHTIGGGDRDCCGLQSDSRRWDAAGRRQDGSRGLADPDHNAPMDNSRTWRRLHWCQ